MSLQVNEDHFNQWLEQMRNPLSVQAQGALCKWRAESTGYCCLGLGSLLVPGLFVHFIPHDEYEDEDDDRLGVVQFGSEAVTDLAPKEFIEWLGLVPPSRMTRSEDLEATDYDLLPDYPAGMTHQGHPRIVTNTDGSRIEEPVVPPMMDFADSCSAAGMNDGGMTFSQIADVFAYFGVGQVIAK